jgi:hypothetical protein
MHRDRLLGGDLRSGFHRSSRGKCNARGDDRDFPEHYLPAATFDRHDRAYRDWANGSRFQTDNEGTDDQPIGDIILDLCAKGTSVTYQRVIPQVWEALGSDGKPVLSTAILPAFVSTRYIVRLANVKSFSLRRSLSNIQNRVRVRYKLDTDGTLAKSVRNDTASQSNLGVDFTGGGTITNFIRVGNYDVSNNYSANATNADRLGDTILNRLKRVSNQSQAIVIEKDWVIFDVQTGQEIPNWAVRAGQWLQIPDLFPRGSESGTGTNSGDQTHPNYILYLPS